MTNRYNQIAKAPRVKLFHKDRPGLPLVEYRGKVVISAVWLMQGEENSLQLTRTLESCATAK